MKHIVLISTWLLTINAATHAQQDLTLPGQVVRQNSRIHTGQVEYLSNVSIKATQAAPTRSDAKGQFTLVFADKPAYNVTRVFAEKSGMDVVNKTDLERAAVLGRLEKLKIVMCPSRELMENQMLYYGIAEDAIVYRFKKRITALETANTGLGQLIAQVNEEFNLDLKTKNEAIYALEKEWSKALTSAQELAQKFAAINLDDADSLYLQADAAFRKGDFDRVLQLLQYELLDKNFRNIRSNLSAADSLSAEGRSRIARGTENLRQTIQNALFAARVAELDGDWKRAADYYDLAVAGNNKDAEVIFEAAHFMQAQNQFAKARKYYEEALQIYRQLAEKKPDVYLPDMATTLNNLGALLRANNEVTPSLQATEEALQIRRELAEKNPDVYLPDVALALNNLGALFFLKNEIIAGKKAYEESLKIYRQQAEKNPDINLPNMALTLNNLGNLLSDNNEMGAAKQAHEEALQIRRELAEKNPDVYLPDVAMTLNNLGIWLKANNEMGAAKQAFEEALQIRRELAEKNPDAHLPNMANSLNSLGILLKANNEMGVAKQAFEEAFQIYRQLAEKNPDVYLPNVAMTFNNLGMLLHSNNEMSAAKKAYEEALQIYRKLVAKHPDINLPNMALVLNNLGAWFSDNNEMSAALQVYEEALQVFMQLSEKNPDVYLPNVALTLNNFGAFLKDNNEMRAAIQAYEEALQIYRQLSEKNPDVYLPNVALTLNNLGGWFDSNNEMNDAKQAYEEALQIRRKLAESNPATYNLDVAMTDINIGLLYLKLLQTSGDLSLKKEGLNLMEDATQRLIIYPVEHQQAQQYRSYIHKLRQFFKDYDDDAIPLDQQLERLNLLEDQNQVEKDPNQKVLRQQEVVMILLDIEKTMPNNEEVKKSIASRCGSLAWYQLFDMQYEAAEQSARLGLEKAPNETWINTYVVLALLYQGKWEAAKQIYAGMKDEKYGNNTYRDAFLEDLDALEKEGITHPHVAKARKLLLNK